eukprot:Gregarina_sp_Poly_1__5875@NODE_3098_length_1385_cov_280_263278_g1962_i0_p1_GENE_NODE_3098_length_1385_cov_280_263278_g1962_i0NODE_3098_length_1385_cov_280_263278_g1962_i0_p1_ORF_typecomplete_len220_score14_98_NODE_3098_length_1385_cov_280_263278_g1962_i07251300
MIRLEILLVWWASLVRSTVSASTLSTQLPDSEILYYTMLCSGTLHYSADNFPMGPTPLFLEIAVPGPLQQSICTKYCHHAIKDSQIHWNTIDELVQQVADVAQGVCTRKAVGMLDLDRTAHLSRTETDRFCSFSVTGAKPDFNRYCLYVCWLLLDSGGFQCPGTGTMTADNFRSCFLSQQKHYCMSIHRTI